jgi:hypothetical protein
MVQESRIEKFKAADFLVKKRKFAAVFFKEQHAQRKIALGFTNQGARSERNIVGIALPQKQLRFVNQEIRIFPFSVFVKIQHFVNASDKRGPCSFIRIPDACVLFAQRNVRSEKNLCVTCDPIRITRRQLQRIYVEYLQHQSDVKTASEEAVSKFV